MSLAKIVENGIIVDNVGFKVIEKEGRKMAYFKKYGSFKEHFTPFDPQKAHWSLSKKGRGFEAYFDRGTLMQMGFDEAFKDKKLADDKLDKSRQASDILYAHKEAKKRMGGDTQNLAILISWIAMIIITVLMFLSTYYYFTTPHTITLHCDNCNGAPTTTIQPGGSNGGHTGTVP